jgi:hypothetical protein
MAEVEMLDAERLRKITDEMITAITSPPFVEAMRTMKTTPQDQRLKVGAKILNPEALRSKGVPLPAGMRITSRYFESGKPTIEVADPDEAGHPPIVKEIADIRSLSSGQTKGGQTAGMCAGGGAGTVCGCAGG